MSKTLFRLRVEDFIQATCRRLYSGYNPTTLYKKKYMITLSNDPFLAAELIKQRVPNFKPKLGIILGSGLGQLAHQIKNSTVIDYSELPGFVTSSIEGHAGKLHLGLLNDLPVVCLQGRVHLYEGIHPATIQILIRTLKLIGCDILLLTNSAGSLHLEMEAGNIMMINDHINLQFSNPLVGPNDERFGDRFVSMEDAYDPDLRQQMHACAKPLGIKLYEGVYLGVLGPSFETPAEIRAFRTLGADAVGMSTIPEVIAARHCDIKIVALSVITNLAAGLSPEKISHKGTLAGAELTIRNLTNLVLKFIALKVETTRD